MAASNPKPDSPDTTGYSVVDCTGISIGNSDIESSSVQGEVRPEDVQQGTTPLPIYPRPTDLPESPARAMPQPFVERAARQGSDL